MKKILLFLLFWGGVIFVTSPLFSGGGNPPLNKNLQTKEIPSQDKLEGKILGEGLEIKGVRVNLFDGFSFLTTESREGGKFEISFPLIPPSYPIVVFFSKEGYLPQIKVLGRGDQGQLSPLEMLKPLKDPNQGVLTGVCYQAIRGGKLQEKYGISKLLKGVKIKIKGEEKEEEQLSGAEGSYLFLLKEGSYKLSWEGSKEAFSIKVIQNKTTIHNLLLRMTLID